MEKRVFEVARLHARVAAPERLEAARAQCLLDVPGDIASAGVYNNAASKLLECRTPCTTAHPSGHVPIYHLLRLLLVSIHII